MHIENRISNKNLKLKDLKKEKRVKTSEGYIVATMYRKDNHSISLTEQQRRTKEQWQERYPVAAALDKQKEGAGRMPWH